MSSPINVGPGEGRTIAGPVGGPLTFKVTGAETGGTLTAFENVIPPGQGPPLHTHDAEDEAWYLIEGALRFRIGDEESEATQGSFVFVPRGTPHAFRNETDSESRILVLFTPSGMEAFFEGFAEVPKSELGPETFIEHGEPVGMTIVGPPLG
jgi:quercetin dioxygenase-like cupin family protein